MRRVLRSALPRRSPCGASVRLLLVLVLALAPALNLAVPMASRTPVATAASANDRTTEIVAYAGFADARFDFCLPASQPVHGNTGRDGARHAGGHHADPLCLQCVAFGVPGLPGAPDIVVAVSTLVVENSYRCYSDTEAATRDLAAQGCRGPPVAA